MKESITKFDLEAAFKALDEIEIPVADKVKANKPALTEIFSRKSKFDALLEEYYDISDMAELDDAKDAREAEVAQAKLARIEKIVDLDAESPEDLLPSYVGKFIIQCPQCMTLFYKNPEDVEASEEDPDTVNINEVCQHCGNEAGYMLIGKVGEATEEERAEYNEEETVDVTSTEEDEELVDETAEEPDEEFDLDLEEIEIEDEVESDKQEEAFNSGSGEQTLVEKLSENTDLDISADEFEDLINSPEFKKPMSDSEARAMMNELSEKKETVEESVKVNNETLKFAVINPDGTYAGVPCTSEEEARELAAQREGRIIVALGELKEGIFDSKEKKLDFTINSLKKEFGIVEGLDNSSKIVEELNKPKSREEKANWILENAIESNSSVQANKDDSLEPIKENKRFNTFVVIGFSDTYTNGEQITAAPAFNTKNLVIGMQQAKATKRYQEAENIAKGWSMRKGNGPAFIYLAKSPEDKKAVFLCEFFEGELKYDQLDKYLNIVEKDLTGA